jgi:hypothetical protein
LPGFFVVWEVMIEALLFFAKKAALFCIPKVADAGMRRHDDMAIARCGMAIRTPPWHNGGGRESR